MKLQFSLINERRHQAIRGSNGEDGLLEWEGYEMRRMFGCILVREVSATYSVTIDVILVV